MTNAEISDILALYAKLMDIHGEDSFKTKSYSNAAFQIDNLSQQLAEVPKEQLAKIRGIGDSVAKSVIELIETQKLQALETLLKKTPEGILELMKIKGIGPKKLATIWKELEIETPGELLYACNENRLVNYKGFGAKTQQTIAENIEFYLSNQKRYLWASIEPVALQIESILKKTFSEENVTITGAFRRQCEILDSLEFIIESEEEFVLEGVSQLQGFVFDKEEDGIYFFNFGEMISIEIHVKSEADGDELLFFTTGTPSFNDAFQDAFPDVTFEGTEMEIFENAGISFIPPCLREDNSIIEFVKQHEIPNLIQVQDVKGIIHNHSTWSDGGFSIEQMARACISKGFEYLVMSDHSVTSYYAKGLSVERIFQQHEEIDKLNEQLKPFKIFKSIECDILNDGRLDYEDSVLKTFDLVIVSVHQNLKMTEEKAMMRLMNAIQNPYTRILGHPTGRLLLSRKEYPIDHGKIIEACKEHNVVIEINANPRRLDLDWRWINYARECGVMLSINPDAHSIHGIDDIRYGVLTAQKGMLTKEMNLSSKTLSEFELFIKSK